MATADQLKALIRCHAESWRTSCCSPTATAGWAFPSRNGDGEVAPVRSPRIQKYDAEGTKMDAMPSPHRLRHTFASACSTRRTCARSTWSS